MDWFERLTGFAETSRNGYALASSAGLKAIEQYLQGLDAAQRDRLGALLRLGLHSDVEVTLADTPPQRPRVSQIFCSALPMAYGTPPARQWEALARLVLDAACEATLLAGVINRQRGRSPVVALTLLGGGAFGNPLAWILDAAAKALSKVRTTGLDVRLVSHGAVPPAVRAWVQAQSLGA